MSPQSFSVRTRLAIGFALLLAIFTVPSLIMLQQLANLREVSAQMALRLEVRRHAMGLAKAAGRMSRVLQEPGEFDPDRAQAALGELRGALQRVAAETGADPQPPHLPAIRLSVERLADLIDTASALSGRPSGMPEELRQEALQVVLRVEELNRDFIEAVDLRSQPALEAAAGAWELSLGIAKLVFPVVLLVALLIIYFTHRSVVGPVSRLVEGTKRLASGDLEADIHLSASTEFQELAASFNRMAHALKANQRQLVEAEKMVTVGRLAAGVAHEINNPMAVIVGYARMLLAELDEDDPRREGVQAIADEAVQCKNIITSLLDLSRPSEAQAGEVVNPRELVAEVLTLAQALQLADGVQVDVSVIDRPLPLTISHSRLRQLVLNLVRNALEAVQGLTDARVRVEGYVRPREKLDEETLEEATPDAVSFLVYVFSDNGPGIPARHVDQLFEPFFTTRPEGTGLGLAISHNLARIHGGFICVDSAGGEGSTFTVGLPIAER